MKIESKTVTVNKEAQELSQWLSSGGSFKELMPSNLSKFKADSNGFMFALSGMPDIFLTHKSTTDNQVIYEAAAGKIPFELTLEITPLNSNSSQVQFIFNGNFNPMLSMMVKNPLTKLIDTMAQNISTI